MKPYLLLASAAEVIEINGPTQMQSMAVRGWLSSVVALLSATFVIAHGEYTQNSRAVAPVPHKSGVYLQFLFLLTFNFR